MSKRNPIEQSQYINSQYKEYLRSSFEFKTPKLQKLFEQQLEVEDLFKGPYVDLNLPFKRGMSLDEMIADGAVCKSFRKLGDMNFERPLYSHQEESIRRICSGRSAIITTGTGSGKTESFLYPILNELMSDVEKGNMEVGIRAIFLYPMNALVNDQIDRVRKILTQCPEITYGFFTGETKESVPKNYREKYGAENDTFIPENELVSREEIRKNPPHLLFTNYSMLEYLLIRPNDYSIFAPERLNNWKFVVLDEAHSYYGSLGIELSLLMRRLTGLAPNKPRFILTSATLGEQGKSESEIVNFARSLTSANFDIQDIIFSKRILLSSSKLSYTIDAGDYSEIKKAKDDIQTVRTIGNRYKNIDSMDLKSYLYELFVGDRNVFHLYEILKDGSKSFKSILVSFNNQITSEQLIDLIDLINMAEKDGIGIFDLKYHSFVHPLAGAYITLGNNPQLSLTKTNMLGDLKAFEAGNCRYCNSPYIIGKIQRNEGDGLDYLYQNKEVDIYENYGNNEFVSVDYFLLSNELNEEEVDRDILEEYKVCSKCGAIHVAGNLNARRCNCGDSFQHSIFKVLQSKKDGEETAFNNINQCPCCGHKARAGVVKSLNVGKDEGTALLAQILYEAIDDGTETKKKTGKLSLKRKESIQSEPETSNVKQFLAFSDSRQQASFSAAFLDSNQVRMLQKRLIWKVIEDNQYRNISVDQLTATLSGMIKEGNLFQNDLSAHKNAWITTLVDLLKVDGLNDGEGLGLYFFDVDLTDINSIKSTLTPDEKMKALEYRRFDNYVMFNCPKTINGVRSFLPVKGKDNMVVRYVQKVCDCDEESAKALLEVVFNNLAVKGELFKKHETKECYQIEASKYVVKNYKTSKYYICSKCGHLTPYNVHNKCVQDKCDGTLSEVDPDEALATNYYRRQYKTKKIESIVVKEHTAQLDRKKAKQYQQDFKNKKINILSCSTTFEMGIDIGNLETVFMRNVPPSPANYVQRAGRAGRRKDSAAYILTYCGTGSHDYTYFCNPEKMISGVIKPPCFNVVNHKIIVRHLMATCLGFFFRQHPDYFISIDELVFGNALEEFKNYISSHPSDLNIYINEKILPGDTYRAYHNFKWFDEIEGNDEKMEHFVSTIKSIAEEYEKAKKEAVTEENYKEADYYQRQIENLHKEKVIDSLSKYCIIPKYGFPVDVVELQIYKEGIMDNSYDLSRDLKIAISEYAPDSEIIVDGKKYTSKYISLPKTGEYPRNYFC
ncbi:MAG: DEAD/DEAH box helicase, partial [Clostridiales bacterium]|nr:DEAD/DEAH box helicase [Clostridiales bacterium]